MKKEIITQQGIDHPNILAIIKHADDYRWYSTEQAECSLDGLGPFPREQWMTFRAGMLGVASAISYAHDRGLVHRDLSPGNILVFAAGWAVSDWGFVSGPSNEPRLTQPLERFGTPDFMAPEQAADPHLVGPPADVYALGRIASWGTKLKRGESATDDHPFTKWWRVLIDGTTAYDPGLRWTMQDVQTHLRSRPPAEFVEDLSRLPPLAVPMLATRPDLCPHCFSDAGRDAAEHCLTCYAPLSY